MIRMLDPHAESKSEMLAVAEAGGHTKVLLAGSFGGL